MSMEELKTVKKYLKTNLKKKFIVPTTAFFTSSILIVHNGAKLCFCVNFHKLKAISKHDQYLLLLRDDSRHQRTGAIYFIYLNICQEFHRIHMSEESEDLTSL
ncbi:predicted protein [Uncinocarpus reesii 1704]|uniref:Uncharacterized protein n=1 Tax=Uncinocarpus reesii (strain UAMH 1704) TaxID=336963 RepID=C4JUC8_UNCRE|nr:uncharacterized protein UREG_06067 [Uncinocarpus reesii 1704]EEP81225.1 predicted protein [Uncinocarpus reesii 1704]